MLTLKKTGTNMGNCQIRMYFQIKQSNKKDGFQVF